MAGYSAVAPNTDFIDTIENLPMGLSREMLVSTNASEVEQSVEVRNTSDRGHFCFRSDILLL